MSEQTQIREDARYPHVLRTVAETPWAILPSKLVAILEVVALRASGERFTEDEIRARLGQQPPQQQGPEVEGTVAVLPLYGTIMPRADIFTDMSGGTSVQRFQEAFRGLVEDDNVSAIVFDVDSPGGLVDLVPELAAEIRAARGRKPLYAVANTLAASAAYWIAAQADELYVTPSGEVGSIGVFAAHDDITKLQEELGIKTTLVSAGEFKTELSPFVELSDEARAALQARIDECYDLFVGDVAAGRGVSAAAVRDGFGQGRVLMARAALREGMVDGVATLEQVVERALLRSSPGNNTMGAFAHANTTTVTQTQIGSWAPGLRPLEDRTTDAQAATSGLSFADEASAARDAATATKALIDRTRSLAEMRRGRLTAAKREQLSALENSHREIADALAGLLADTNPDKHKAELAGLHASLYRPLP